ncbi:MAG: hypothetical protein JO337_12125 [Acidimicrobiales bacterium]|nr:hypothetical protein [Acidimicrobiales bacterium]
MPTSGELDVEEFDCPRCGGTVTERFWGPCRACRDELVAAQRRDAADLEVGRFEPALHVVPNHVATKD